MRKSVPVCGKFFLAGLGASNCRTRQLNAAFSFLGLRIAVVYGANVQKLIGVIPSNGQITPEWWPKTKIPRTAGSTGIQAI